jgi:uncharacterized protein YwbE
MTRTKLTEFYMPVIECTDGETFLFKDGIALSFNDADENTIKKLKTLSASLKTEIKLYKFTRNIVKTIKPASSTHTHK